MGSSRRGLRRYEGAITSGAGAGPKAPRNWEERQESAARRTEGDKLDWGRAHPGKPEPQRTDG